MSRKTAIMTNKQDGCYRNWMLVQVIMHSCVFLQAGWNMGCLTRSKLPSLRVHYTYIQIYKEFVNCYYRGWNKTSLINCVNEGTVSGAHSDAKQCNEQWERTKRVENIEGVNHSGKEWWCKRVERAKTRGKQKKKRKAVVRETGCRHSTTGVVCKWHLHKEDSVVEKAFVMSI